MYRLLRKFWIFYSYCSILLPRLIFFILQPSTYPDNLLLNLGRIFSVWRRLVFSIFSIPLKTENLAVFLQKVGICSRASNFNGDNTCVFLLLAPYLPQNSLEVCLSIPTYSKLGVDLTCFSTRRICARNYIGVVFRNFVVYFLRRCLLRMKACCSMRVWEVVSI